MGKPFKITLNILLFILIAGFGYYIIHSMASKEETMLSDAEHDDNRFVSPYKKGYTIDFVSEIVCFEIFQNTIYVALSGNVSVFDVSGKHLRDFEVAPDIRDIAVDETFIYLLYPTLIACYTLSGEPKERWEACSDHSDYCALTTTQAYVLVTDVANKHICQYDKEGRFIRFITSPQGFIIPSYSFDIISINDTLYCANSGRHHIESYTLNGDFIASFGVAGTEAGAFAGCCNPVYLAKSSDNNIITSEKGNPRISCYGKTGKFRTILFDSHALGGGTTAREMHVWGERIFIANKKSLLVYAFDPALAKESCTQCEAACPLAKKAHP